MRNSIYQISLIAALAIMSSMTTGCAAQPASEREYVRQLPVEKDKVAQNILNEPKINQITFVKINVQMIGPLWPEEPSIYNRIEPQGALVGMPMGRDAELKYGKVRPFSASLLPTKCGEERMCVRIKLREGSDETHLINFAFDNEHKQFEAPWQGGILRMTLQD